VQRENLSPIEEAAGYKNLMDKCGYSVADVMRVIGKSESYLRNAVRLLNLPLSVQKMVESGELSPGAARAIVVADDPESLARAVIAGNMNVREAEEAARRATRSTAARKHTTREIDTVRISDLEKKLTDKFGLKTKLKIKKNGTGVAAIYFKDISEIEKI
ncbi:MAG: hypothetical protein LBR41_01180, partial [Rickettsiales bacterium]|nr:hypothetical protein [Rickettsiales bacterium]